MCSGLMILCFAGGCGGGAPAGGEGEKKEPETLTAVCLDVLGNASSSDQSQRVFRPIGRTFSRNGGLACDLTCTGVAFRAAGKGAIRVSFTTSAVCYFSVYVDGVRSELRLEVNPSKNGEFITAADFPEYGEREIRLVKQSQYAMAYCEINRVEIVGSFGRRPAEKSRFLEFYGDSVLNGSNIHTGGTSVATSDGTLSFGYTAALALDADCNVVGRGGMGLYPKDGSTDGMNQIWDLCGGTASPDVGHYTFGRMPDAVVVELGINDCISDYYTDKRYAESIGEMVFNLRSVYGEDLKIVWCYGYHETLNAKWNVAKAALDGLNGGGHIFYCPLPYCALQKQEGGDGYHPDVKISREMAAALAAFIEEHIYD